MMRSVLFVALGGAVGAVCRFLITYWMHERWSTPFPIGTLTVNLMGCLLIGLAVEASHANAIPPAMRLMILTGLLGAMTTFSTFGHDTFRCLEEQGWRMAVANVFANLVIGMLAVFTGVAAGRWLWANT